MVVCSETRLMELIRKKTGKIVNPLPSFLPLLAILDNYTNHYQLLLSPLL